MIPISQALLVSLSSRLSKSGTVLKRLGPPRAAEPRPAGSGRWVLTGKMLDVPRRTPVNGDDGARGMEEWRALGYQMSRRS